jgi:hypothetical protein
MKALPAVQLDVRQLRCAQQRTFEIRELNLGDSDLFTGCFRCPQYPRQARYLMFPFLNFECGCLLVYHRDAIGTTRMYRKRFLREEKVFPFILASGPLNRS